MKIITPFLWLGGGAALLTMALLQRNESLALAALFAGGVGCGTLFPALKERWSKAAPEEVADGPRINVLEQRLRVTEDELASAARELAHLRDQHDFDLQLQLRKPGAETS